MANYRKNNSSNKMIYNIFAVLITFSSGVLINFFLSPFIVEKVGLEAFGFVTLSNNIIVYLEILTIAINSMGGRYIALSFHQNDKKKATEFFSTLFSANVIVAFFVFVLGWLYIYWLDYFVYVPTEIYYDVKILFMFLLFNFCLTLIMSAYGSIYIITNTLYISSELQLKGNMIKLIVVIFLYYFFPPYISYYALAILISSVFIKYNDLKNKSILVPSLICNVQLAKWYCLCKLAGSGFWNMINRLGAVLSVNLDVLFVTVFLGTESTGIYGLVKIIPTFFYSITGTMVSVFFPNLIELYAKKDMQKMKLEILKAMKLFAAIFNIPIVVFLALGDLFFELWVPTQDAYNLYILSAILLFSLTVVGPATLIYNVFTVVNKVRLSSLLILFTGICAVIAVYASLKYLNWGLIGVAFFPTFFNLIRNVLFVIPYGGVCIGEKWQCFFPMTIKSLILAMACVVIGMGTKSIVEINTWLRFFCVATFLSIVTFCFYYMFLFNREDKKRIKINLAAMKERALR